MLSWRNAVHKEEAFWVWSYGLSLIFLNLCSVLSSWISYCKLSSCCSASLLRSPSVYTHTCIPLSRRFFFLGLSAHQFPLSIACWLACVVLIEASASQDCCSYLLCQSLQHGRFFVVIVFNQGGYFRLPITNIQMKDYRKHPKITLKMVVTPALESSEWQNNGTWILNGLFCGTGAGLVALRCLHPFAVKGQTESVIDCTGWFGILR